MKRKSTACRIVQAFLLVAIVMLLPISVWAQETILTAIVPSNHTLHIEMTGNGTVMIDGVTYTKTEDVQVQRHHKPEISIQAVDGSKIKTVLWGNKDVTEAFQDGKWIAPEIVIDAALTVTFVKNNNIPETGDAFYSVWVGVLIFSLFGLAVYLVRNMKKYA